MRETVFTLLLVAALLPSGFAIAEEINITTVGSGSINNITKSVSSGGDSSVSAFVKNIFEGNSGRVEVRIESQIDGVKQTEEIKKNISDRGVIKVNISTSSNVSVIAERNVEIQAGAEASSTPKVAITLNSWLSRLLNTLTSFWWSK